jgi:uncharacterized membrane protein
MDRTMPAAAERRVVARAVPAGALPVAAGVGAAALFAWSLLSRSDALVLPAYDTAFFQQVVWNLGHGGGFASGFFPASLLGLHMEPLLVVPALLERAWPDARLLSVLDAVALGAAAPAAYLFLEALLGARGRAGGWLAAALAAPVPLWAETQWAAWAGFHTEALALPLVLLAGWAGLRGRTALCWALAVAALAAKEDQAYAVAVIGLLLFVHGPSRHQGAALAGTAVLWGAAAELAIMPALRGGVASQVENYYQWLHTAGPAQVASALANPTGWLAFTGLVAGLAGLPLLRPAWLALAAPPFVADLLSAHPAQPELHLQYGLPLIVPLLVAAGLAAPRQLERRSSSRREIRRPGAPDRGPAPRTGASLPVVGERGPQKQGREIPGSPGNRGGGVRISRGGVGCMGGEDPSDYLTGVLSTRPALLAVLALPALLVGALTGPVLVRHPAAPPALARLQACAAVLPATAPVAADDSAAAALASRPVLRLLTEARPGDHVVVDRRGLQPSYVWQPDRRRVLAALPGQDRRLLCDDGRFQVWGPADA